MNSRLASVITPVAAWALNLACPVVPVFVWSALVGAILSGDITLGHLTDFMADHGIKTYPDYNIQKNGEITPPVVSIQAWRNEGK